MYWANFLHIYQPPTQSREIVDKVTRECYRTLGILLRRQPGARLTLSVAGTLLEQLCAYGHRDVVQALAELAEAGQVELLGSAMFHPILPLVPRREIDRQIELNERALERHLGAAARPKGFFPPELCYSHAVAEVVRDRGYRWILVDEVARGRLIPAPGTVRLETRCYELEGVRGLAVFFKERPVSTALSYGGYPGAPELLAALGPQLLAEGYLLTGTDGEIYGHHRPGQEQLLERTWLSGSPPTCRISDLLRLFPARELASPGASSWSTWPRELGAGLPYPQWDDPENEIHRAQWQLARVCLGLAERARKSFPRRPETAQVRRLLDEGLHSCQWWWASCRPWWDVGMIEAGATRLGAAAEAARPLFGDQVDEADTLVREVSALARRWQSSGEAARRRARYRAETPEVTSELTFGPGSAAPLPASSPEQGWPA